MIQFELPMPSSVELDDSISNDLGLADMYRNILKSNTCFGERTLDRWTKRCTADVRFLEETQRLLRTELPKIDHDCSAVEAIHQTERNEEGEEGFHSKYQYIDWEPLMFLNKNRTALQWMSLYSMTSPILSLCLPIICLIIPFFVIRMKGITITLGSYIEVLQTVLKQHQLGQLFALSTATWDKRIYILMSVGFYVLGIYQNARTCARFYKNMTTVHHELITMRNHVHATIQYIDRFNACAGECRSYTDMLETLGVVRGRLIQYREKLDDISPEVWSSSKMFEIGHVMACFYELHHDAELRNLLEYTFDLCGYLDNLYAAKSAVDEGRIGPCMFTNKKSKFYGAYLPGNSVTNTYSVTKHTLITGPNAAGKTTLLKATLFNIILSQQFGYGCYQRASLRPYHYIHCYLNIPDTNGRDSLFQAEARRCKDIIDSVMRSDLTQRHFCVFDELYSGTNPYEAVGSAVAFLKYLNQYPNVTFMLTTHFIDLCEKLDRNSCFRNRHMCVRMVDGEFRYLYKISNGISRIKGGVKVLKELKYPHSVIEHAYELINET